MGLSCTKRGRPTTAPSLWPAGMKSSFGNQIQWKLYSGFIRMLSRSLPLFLFSWLKFINSYPCCFTFVFTFDGRRMDATFIFIRAVRSTWVAWVVMWSNVSSYLPNWRMPSHVKPIPSELNGKEIKRSVHYSLQLNQREPPIMLMLLSFSDFNLIWKGKRSFLLPFLSWNDSFWSSPLERLHCLVLNFNPN